MKTVNLTSRSLSVDDLLSMARKETLLVTAEDGAAFVISVADDFDAEVELLRKNHTFLTLLDELKQGEESIPLEAVEKKLR